MTIDKETLERCADASRKVYYKTRGKLVIDPDRIYELMAEAVIREYQRAQWRPIETKEPGDDTCIGYDPKNSSRVFLMDCRLDGKTMAYFDATSLIGWKVNPTHWMPLPEPPEA